MNNEIAPYPADPEDVLKAFEAAAPFCTEEAVILGYLTMMAATENARQKDWIYTVEYYGGKWVKVARRRYVYEFEGKEMVVRADTDAASVVGLAGAVASMRAAAVRG